MKKPWRRSTAALQRGALVAGVLVTCHVSLVTPLAFAETSVAQPAKPADIAKPPAPAARPSASGLKIGYVNLAQVFDSYQRTKQSEQVLEQRGKEKQGELEGRVGELKKLRQNLELLGDQAREAKAREIEEKSDEFQRLKTRTERDLVRERNEAARQILHEIEQTVTEYARANGFSIIVEQRSLVYGENALDVTDDVLKILNEHYEAKAGSSKHQ
ncbi:MAG: OmpH family outer membrane protein [Candidatus Omnitrophica bacterium]|nr:OmpH family outer membrane protein [Candidatus Omnitrophota bacterium]